MIEPVDVLEALLFASDAPVEPGLIQDVLELESHEAARELIDALRRRFEEQGRVLQIIEAGGGFRLVTRPEVLPWLVKLARSKTRSRLSRPALETLAIVAYRQPVSRPEVDATRGVNSEGVLDNLLERRLIRIAGRKDSPGRPFLYETTREFLVAFGLRDLGDLPKVEGELLVVDPSATDAAVAGPAEESEATARGVEGETLAEEPRDDATGAGEDTPARAANDAIAADGAVADAPDAPENHGPDAHGATLVAASDDHVADVRAIAGGDARATSLAGAERTPAHDGAEITGARSHDASALPAEDASAADDSPQQDPRAGGTDVAPGR